MGHSIIKNLTNNLLLKVITLFLFPLTIHYLSRIFGVEGIGIYSFTMSITQYFIIIVTLGLSIYGNRQIAYTRVNEEEMSKGFGPIYFNEFLQLHWLNYLLLSISKF